MKRILFSTGIIIFTLISVTAGGTGAFFSDKETSTGNTFTAGAIDLKIDNASYYNGALNPDTSWSLSDLTIQKFFNFLDLKPGDVGEDTISLHVDNNDSYVCANVKLTSNNENGCTEPEALADSSCGNPGPGEGELAQNVHFIWWADDGDNVLEEGETLLPGGTLGNLAVGSSTTVALADSSTNIWSGTGPIAGGSTHYIGKAWCFGNLTPSPLPQDGLGTTSPRTPANSNGGINCDGSTLDNSTQSDSLTADVSFTAVQSRHNGTFLCNGDSCKFDNTLNLVADGGFETPVVGTPDKWDVFPSPVSGWKVDWRSDIPTTFGSQTRPTIANLELHRGVLGPASEGEQYAELDTDWGGPTSSGTGEPASVNIYQDIPTVPGASYKLKYAFAPRPNTSADENNLKVSWGGNVVSTSGPTAGGGSIVWSQVEVDVVATTTTTRVEFTDMGTADSSGTFLDNVSLTQLSCSNQIN